MGRRAKRPIAVKLSDEMLVLHQLIRREVTLFLEHALEEEFEDFLRVHADKRLPNDTQAVVRNGYLPERRLLTQIGEITVRVPRARDRSDSGVRFTSVLLPPYLSRTQMHAQLPAVFLEHQLTGATQAREGSLLRSLLGDQVLDIDPATLDRIHARWFHHNQGWRERALTGAQYLCWWAGAVQDASGAQLLFVIGLQPTAGHNLLAVSRESVENEAAWTALLQGLRQRGLVSGPRLASASGRNGFQEALSRFHPGVQDLGGHAFDSSSLHQTAADIRYI